MGRAVCAAGHQRGNVVGQLERGVLLIGLTEGRPGRLVLPGLVDGLTAGALADLNAGGFPQTEGGVILVEGVQPHAVAHFHEIGVAGVGDGAGGVDPAVTAVVPAIGWDFPSRAGVHPVTGVEHRFRGGGDAGLQRRHSGGGLQGGAGSVRGGGGSVEQRLGGVGREFGEVLPVGGKVVGGVGGQRQHLTGAHFDDGGAGAPAVQPVPFIQLCHFGGQRILHRLLKIQIQRQFHRVAGARLCFIVFAGDFAVTVDGGDPLAVGAPEVLLKGGLRAGDADGVAGPVAFFFQFVGIVGDGTHQPQHMGGVSGFVGAGGGAADLRPLKRPVADEGAKFHIHVFHQNVGIVVGAQLPQLQFVPDTQNQPGVLLGTGGIHVHILPHPLQQLGRGDAGLQQQGVGKGRGLCLLQQIRILGGGGVQRGFSLGRLLQQGGIPADIGSQQFPGGLQIPEIGEKVALLGIGQGVHREAGGVRLGEGEIILPVHPLFPAQLQQPQDGGILILPGFQQGGVKGQAVGILVGNKRPAGAVCDDAPGGRDGFHPGDGLGGLGKIVLVVNHLNIEKHHQIDAQHGQRQCGEHPEPVELVRLLVHGIPLLIISVDAEKNPPEQPGCRQAPWQGNAQFPQSHRQSRPPGGMAAGPEDDAVKEAGKEIGGKRGGKGAEIPCRNQALGQQSGGQSHQRENQRVEAGNGGGKQQVAEDAEGQGVHRSRRSPFKGGGDGGNQGIQEGNDAPEGEPPEHGGLKGG